MIKLRVLSGKEVVAYEWLIDDGWMHERTGGTITVAFGGTCPINGIRQQFTGLTDKNGVEIYEGDQVLNEIKGHHRITQTIKNRGIVERDRAHFGIKWISGATHRNIYWNDMMINGTKHIEVIPPKESKQ